MALKQKRKGTAKANDVTSVASLLFLLFHKKVSPTLHHENRYFLQIRSLATYLANNRLIAFFAALESCDALVCQRRLYFTKSPLQNHQTTLHGHVYPQ